MKGNRRTETYLASFNQHYDYIHNYIDLAAETGVTYPLYGKPQSWIVERRTVELDLLALDHPIEVLSLSLFVVYTSIAWWNPENVNTKSYTLGWWKTNTDKSMKLTVEKNSNSTNKKSVRKNGMAHEVVSNGTKLEKRKLRIVLLGATGSGKSSAGNALLNKDVFKTSHYATPETKLSEWKSVTRDLHTVDIIDTPAVNDIGEKDENIENQIEKAVSLSSEGPHAFLLCIPATSITEYYTKCFESYKQYFLDPVDDYIIVVFTRYDQFEMECGDKNDPTDSFNKELAHAIEKGIYFKNIPNNHILLGNKSKDGEPSALAQVIDIIQGSMKKKGESQKSEFARSKLWKEKK